MRVPWRAVRAVCLVWGLLALAPSLASAGASEADTTVIPLDPTIIDEGRIGECVAALDTLRTLAFDRIFDGFGAQSGADLPKTITPSGILMVYTITGQADSVCHQFSAYGAPHPPNVLGKWLVGMACLRFGLPAPPRIEVCLPDMFHAEWWLGRSEHDSLAAVGPPAWPESLLDLSEHALEYASSSELRRVDSGDGAVQKVGDGGVEDANGESAN